MTSRAGPGRGSDASGSRWREIADRQTGRTFVVTGASSGLGLATARTLAAADATVVLGVRDLERGRAAVREIRRTTSQGELRLEHLDLADLTSVRAFAATIEGLDVLIANAGVMAVPFARTADGFELQWGVNHLGHFALALLLLPRLRDRVTVVGSLAHRSGRIDLDDLDFARRGYRPYAAYAASKLANLLFLAELQRRLGAAGSRLRATGGHPGYSATGITSATASRAFTRLADVGRHLAMTAERGALPILHAATEDLPGNSYLGPGGPGELRGWPAGAGRSAAALDPGLARAVWESSATLTETEFAPSR